MGSREYGIDFSPGDLGPRGGGKAPIRILGRNEDCPVGGSTRCRDRGWIRSRQGLPPDPGPSVAAVPKALDQEPAQPKHAQGPVPGRGRQAGSVRRMRGHGQPMRLACGSPVRPDPHPVDAEVHGRDVGVGPVHARRGVPVQEGERQVPSLSAVLREARVPDRPALRAWPYGPGG